ncbi:MAG: ACT domain-containing protein [candidate division WOR-3 bacterium]|nr:MAG: ACT domain-containing protein [candidate division WOR-3 bacterium]
MIEKIEQNTNIAKVTLHNVVDRYGIAADVFSALGEHGLNVELISSSSSGRGRADISFAVLQSDLDEVVRLLETTKSSFGAQELLVDKNCALLTIYGAKLATTPGVAGKIFKTLSESGINIDMISASLTVLSIVVEKGKIKTAAEAIQKEFQ